MATLGDGSCICNLHRSNFARERLKMHQFSISFFLNSSEFHTESLNIFNKIFIEIYAFKNIKVKIQILDIIFHKPLLIHNEQ